MAREYARIMTAIWRNREFRALDEASQRLYLMLVTQPDISAAGVLALRLRRWSEMAVDSKPGAISSTLEQLERGRFILVDFDTEEVLVRSFIRWDGGSNNPKRRPVIVRAADEVDSTRLRRALAAEFERVGLPPLVADALSDSPSDRASHTEWVGYEEPSAPGAAETASPQVNRLSDSPSDAVSPSDGVVVTQLSTTDTTTHNSQPVPPAAAQSAQPIVAAWIDGCRKRPPAPVVGQTSKQIRALLEEGIDPEDVRTGVQMWASKGLHPSALPSVVNELMNATPAAVPNRNRRPTADDKIAALQALKTGNGGANVYALPRGAAQ
jgi:hypothetical protein